MNLPKINSPVYDLVLPINKKKVRFRPFSVKEQKILLMSIETDEKGFSEENLKQIIRNCCLEKDLDIDSLSTIDIEYFFLHLRARSVGEIVELRYRCENIVEEQRCGNSMKMDLNLLDIGLSKSDFQDTIKLTQSVGIKMKLPDYSTVSKENEGKSATKVAFDLIVSCIEYIYDEDKIYNAKEHKKEELEQFIESLTLDQFKLIENFFQNIPKLQKKMKVKCSKCGFEHEIKIEGLENFLG